MEIGDKFCLDNMQDACYTKEEKGCDGCPSFQTYKECTECGIDSSCTSIGDDNLCNACRMLNEDR